MKILSLTCPFCSAGLQADSGTKFADCPYCGQRFMIYDENPEKKAHKIRKTDELLFDDAVTFLQRGEYKMLGPVFEKMKKDSPSNPDGWFFEGCYYILVFVAQEEDFESDFDDDMEFSDIMMKVRSSWMRSFKYVKDEDLMEEYFKCIGYSLGHLSRLMLFNENVYQIISLLSDIQESFSSSISFSECCHVAFLGIGDILKTMDSIDRRSDFFEYIFLNSIAFDSNISSVVGKFDELDSLQNILNLGYDCADQINALQQAFSNAEDRLSPSEISRIASLWSEEQIDSKLSKYWDALMEAEEPSGLKSLFKKKGPNFDTLAEDYVNALIRGPSGS